MSTSMNGIKYVSPPCLSNAATLTANLGSHSTLNAHAPIFIPAATGTAHLGDRKQLNPLAAIFAPAGSVKRYPLGRKRLDPEATIFTPTAATDADHASASFSSALAHKLSPTAKAFIPRLHVLTPPSPPPQKFTRLSTSLPSTRSFYQVGKLFPVTAALTDFLEMPTIPPTASDPELSIVSNCQTMTYPIKSKDLYFHVLCFSSPTKTTHMYYTNTTFSPSLTNAATSTVNLEGASPPNPHAAILTPAVSSMHNLEDAKHPSISATMFTPASG
ncbi:hypothetical protein BZA77DRAFT_358743 [Pyronema omphalodes]|nr:hypothetical protein BZA77DRAFT_358743 [Pyronema omphalodes]